MSPGSFDNVIWWTKGKLINAILKHASEWLGDWVSEWMSEWVGEWVSECVSGWVSESERASEWYVPSEPF